MSFGFLAILGFLALASGAIACAVYHANRFDAPRPSALRFFAVALLVAFGAYLAGSVAGISVACSTADAGNLCGLQGLFGVGPLVAGLALWAYGPLYRRAMRGQS